MTKEELAAIKADFKKNRDLVREDMKKIFFDENNKETYFTDEIAMVTKAKEVFGSALIAAFHIMDAIHCGIVKMDEDTGIYYLTEKFSKEGNETTTT